VGAYRRDAAVAIVPSIPMRIVAAASGGVLTVDAIVRRDTDGSLDLAEEL